MMVAYNVIERFPLRPCGGEWARVRWGKNDIPTSPGASLALRATLSAPPAERERSLVRGDAP